MYTISRDLRGFSAAHRLNKGYEGKCKHLHGHSYAVRVTMTAGSLDQYDFVMDFDDIKAMFDTWVQQNWDHATLVSEMDTTLIAFLASESQRYFVIPGKQNTTSECLAAFLFTQFTQLLADKADRYQNGLRVHEVCVSESTYSHARFKG